MGRCIGALPMIEDFSGRKGHSAGEVGVVTVVVRPWPREKS